MVEKIPSRKTHQGASHRQAMKSHGLRKSKEYGVWCAMKNRCMNPNVNRYKDYGGRGIKVCKRWIDSFEAFYADMGSRPDGFTIDRIDNNADYEPSNCRWVSRAENCRNKRNNRFVKFKGKSKTIAEWAEILCLDYKIVRQRIGRGWPAEKAFTEPIIPLIDKPIKPISSRLQFRISDREYRALLQECSESGVDKSQPGWWSSFLRNRLTKGLVLDEKFTVA